MMVLLMPSNYEHKLYCTTLQLTYCKEGIHKRTSLLNSML